MIGVSSSSACACRAAMGATAASIAVVYPSPAYRYPVANVLGTVPPLPERAPAPSSSRGAGTGSLACSSGSNRRAWFTLDPATCAWMSTPPGERGGDWLGEGRGRADNKRGVHLSRAEQRGCVRLRAVAGVPAREVHGEGEPGLPREYGIGAGAVAASPERGQGAPRGGVQSLGERHEGLRPGRVGRNGARLAVGHDDDIARLGHPPGQIERGLETRVLSHGAALDGRAHHFQAIHLV